MDRTRFELVTEACKATVLANYTNSPIIIFIPNIKKGYGADTQTRTEISGLEDQSTNHCAILAWRLSKQVKLENFA